MSAVPGALFRRGAFVAHSGARLGWKIECDALTDEDWATLAQVYVEICPQPFGHVQGVPTGGRPFAEALGRHTTPGSDVLLVADDVLTTGRGITAWIDHYPRPTRGVVVFDRSLKPLPAGVTALFRLGAP